ncbi:MAG: TonB-dependent receptor plug domain-containing protein [Opitutaceae bacterium]|jgi:outer membrane receptor for ferric coprogen and ferric-rhodotorulic acid|nr:TonB-dependent receptor plug domain-containing protein [Opitutaceae bacterium]
MKPITMKPTVTKSARIPAALLALGLSIAPPLAAQQTAYTQPPVDSEIVELSRFVVEAERDVGYESMQTTSGMRTVQELKNVPSSISVINATFIDDIGALSIEEMSKWFVTGEANPNPDTSTDGRPIFRGVQSNYAMRNSWIWYTPIDSYSVERVELVRGPNAFLYGEADLGGSNNTITKRGLFTKNHTRVKAIAGSFGLRRAEFDANRILIPKKLALRAAAVASKSDEWYHHGKRDFGGLYLALAYRPTRTTTLRVSGEVNSSERVTTTGLFQQYYGFMTTGPNPVEATAKIKNGTTYIPALGLAVNNRVAANQRTRGSGSNLTLVDPSVLPRKWQFRGPASTYSQDIQTLTIELEQKITDKLHLMLSGNFMESKIDNWNASGRAIYRDLSPKLPDGTANPYYGELYTEYYRTHQLAGNIVRDLRASLVYEWDNLKWMKQTFVLNAQQHQDNPGQRRPKLAEYAAIDTWTPADRNKVTPGTSPADLAGYRASFTNNRFYRRYYLKDGDSARLTGNIHALPGISDYYPDYTSAVYASGAVLYRRFYMPSIAIGASGSYFNDHLFTTIGYRHDKFKMKNINGIPLVQPGENSWTVVPATPANDTPAAIAAAEKFNRPAYTDLSFEGPNLGAIIRINDILAFGYNYAKSYRPSLGLGSDGVIPGTVQGIPFGKGWDASIRLSLLQSRIELNGTYYDNYQPNARVAPAFTDDLKNEMNAIFGANGWNSTGRDTEQLTSTGIEIEMTANLTRHWRIMANYANNKLKTENRIPQLRHYQAAARAQGKPTPELDKMFARYPEGMPTGGYTKNQANLFTRYDFNTGTLKGFYLGGGVNWRDKTYRGTAQLVNGGPFVNVWAPSYATYSFLTGYRLKLLTHPVTLALNVDNLLDKKYYRSAAVGSGSWGAPRTIRLTSSINF